MPGVVPDVEMTNSTVFERALVRPVLAMDPRNKAEGEG